MHKTAGLLKFRNTFMYVMFLIVTFNISYLIPYLLRKYFFQDVSGYDVYLYSLAYFVFGLASGKYFSASTSPFIARIVSNRKLNDIFGSIVTIVPGFLSAVAVGVVAASYHYLIWGDKPRTGIAAYSEYSFWMLAYVFVFFCGMVSYKAFLRKTAYARNFLMLIVLTSVLSLLFVYARASADIKFVFYVVVYLIIGAALFLENQVNVSDTATMNYDGDIPETGLDIKPIRRYNALLTLILFVIITLLFNLKNTLFAIIDWVYAAIVLVLRFVFELILYFLNIPSASSELNGNGFPTIFGGDDTIVKVQDELKEMSPVMRIIILTVIFLLISLLLYYGIRKLIKALRSVIVKLSRFIDSIRIRLGLKSGKIKDYIDESMILKRANKLKKRKRSGLSGSILRFLKRSGIIAADPVEQVRERYASAVRMLSRSIITVRKSDTAGEILLKAAAAAAGPRREYSGIEPALSAMTGIYNDTRYGGTVPDRVQLDIVRKSHDIIEDAAGRG